MAEHQLTAFEQVLLGLVCLSPASGYDLKRIFAATPMGVYQPSSGALYPALRRLEAKDLVRAMAPGRASESARRRRVYEPTKAGHIDPEKIDEYIARDGYRALLTALPT